MGADIRTPLTTDRGRSADTDVPAASRGSIIVWVLGQQRRSLVAWAFAVAAVSGIYASFFVVMDPGEMEALIASMPEGMVAALGYDQLGSAAGYLTSTVYGLLGPILLLVFGITQAARVVAGLEEEGALELELTSAVGRRQVLAERYLALIAQLVILVLAISVTVSVLVVALDMEVTATGLVAGGLGLLLLVLAVATVSFAGGAACGRRAVGLAAGAVVGVGGYLADALAGLLDDGRWLELLSPFSWYLANDPLVEGVDVAGYAALIGLTVVGWSVAVLAFERRDLGT